MRPLAKNTMLQRVSNLRLSIDSSNQLEIFWEGKVCKCGRHGLAVLDTFSEPVCLSEALKKFENRIKGAQDWMDLASTISGLFEVGILIDEEQKKKPKINIRPSKYDGASIHVAMLNDRTRTISFLAGLKEIVRPGRYCC